MAITTQSAATCETFQDDNKTEKYTMTSFAYALVCFIVAVKHQCVVMMYLKNIYLLNLFVIQNIHPGAFDWTK